MFGMVSNNIRIVSVNSVDYMSGIATTTWEDEPGKEGPKIKIPHPFIGNKGEGIFVGLQPGSLVAVGMLSHERYLPLCTIPSYSSNLSNIAFQQEASFDFLGSAQLSSGDIVIQGSGRSMLKLGQSGSIIIKNGYSEGSFLYGSDASRMLIENLPPVGYKVSQSGIKVDGIIRRDLWVNGDEEFSGLLDPNSEFVVEDIGWDTNKIVSYVTRDDETYRNPALVENREIILEYGRDFSVGVYEEELKFRETPSIITPREDDRRERRSNVLSLSLTYPNELIEHSQGTLVDFFGNILDINKNIIDKPSGTDNESFLNTVFENMRHSIAYHMAINTRKGWSYRKDTIGNSNGTLNINLLKNGVPDVNDFSNNSKDRSKWEVNVDKEGLTVINIPATSETGTVPKIIRYETSSVLSVDNNGNLEDGSRELDDSKKVFRNSKNQDIFLEQVGPGGIEVIGEQIENRAKNSPVAWIEDDKEIKKSPEFIQSGTAFHDIRKTANLLLKKDINKKTYDYLKQSTSPQPTSDPDSVSSEINASVPDSNSEESPNAGGRSMVLNLDGSLETSIGANTIDRISWTLDTAGAVVARLGRDKLGRSAIIQADGYVAIEIGGWDFVGEDGDDGVDTRFVGQGVPRSQSLKKDPHRFKGGKLIIRIRRSDINDPKNPDPDQNDHLLIIDDSGITIKSAGVLNLVSKQTMTLESEANICFNAPNVIMYENSPTRRFVRRRKGDI